MKVLSLFIISHHLFLSIYSIKWNLWPLLGNGAILHCFGWIVLSLQSSDWRGVGGVGHVTSHSEAFYSLKHHFWLLEDLDSLLLSSLCPAMPWLIPRYRLKYHSFGRSANTEGTLWRLDEMPWALKYVHFTAAHSLLRKLGWSVCNQKSQILNILF